MIEISHLSKTYTSNGHSQQVLRDLSLSIKSASFTAIAGPSGSGKSTLLSIISGLEKADSGKILYKDFNLPELNENQLAEIRNQHFGFVFQSPFFIPYKNLLDNICLPFSYNPENKRLDKEKQLKRAHFLAELVGLSQHLSKSPAILSGGEQQRMTFARALMMEPDVIFADEPTASLDKNNAEIMLKLLREQVKKGKTVVLVSHDKQALDYADTIYDIKDKGKSIVCRQT